ncbi:hypothetical protein [Marinobacter sp. NFXS9]|uniref:hypothetical protein n=1 Tax=Marinobacter sp. NFXS9 TaxID=2818433 RepID=UPI0032DF0E31
MNKQVRRQVGIKLAKVFADSFGSLSETPSGLLGSGHGELFHLGQVAFYQLKHRFAGGLPIKGVEAKRRVGVFEDDDQLGNAQKDELVCPKNCVTSIERNVDILLGEDQDNAPESWVEVKSYKSKVKSKAQKKSSDRYRTDYLGGKLERWNMIDSKNRKMALHKQFSVDVAALNAGVAWLPKSYNPSNQYDVTKQTLEFEWRFQAFKVDKKIPEIYEISPLLGKKGKAGSIRDLFSKGPDYKASKKEVAKFTFDWPYSIESKAKLITFTRLVGELISRPCKNAVFRQPAIYRSLPIHPATPGLTIK